MIDLGIAGGLLGLVRPDPTQLVTIPYIQSTL